MALMPADVTGTQTVGMESWNAVLAADRLIAHAVWDLGGSLDQPHPGSAYQAVVGRKPFVLPATIGAGGTWSVEVFLLCENVATTITPKLRDVTAGSDVSPTGSACSGTALAFTGTNQHQIWTFTPTVDHYYELWAVKSDTVYQCFLWGRIRRSN